MITAAELQKKIEIFAGSSKGRQLIRSEIKNNPALRKKQTDNYEEAIEILADLIYAKAPPSIASSLTKESIMRGISGPFSSGDDEYSINIDFDKELLKRPSLNKTNPGVYDIAGLLIKGWKPKHNPPKRVSGIWHGEEIVGLVERQPLGRSFIEEAVTWFLLNYGEKYGVMQCVIDDKYSF